MFLALNICHSLIGQLSWFKGVQVSQGTGDYISVAINKLGIKKVDSII